MYGDVVRLQQAMQRLQPRRGGAAQPYYPTGQLSYTEDASGIPSEHKVIHGLQILSISSYIRVAPHCASVLMVCLQV